MTGSHRIILIDSYEASREVLATRLRAQGYDVAAVADSAEGAEMALSEPPAVVVADLWMPGVSGVQLCRLLRSEPATADVPVILRGETDDPKSRFWAGRAGAAAYVWKGRMGDLVRALARAIASAPASDGFFQQLSGGTRDIRDRIAQHLDAALFESVIASEVRALASEGSFDRLFDQLSQLMSQLTSYRWLAVSRVSPPRFGVHHHPKLLDAALDEARRALSVAPDAVGFHVEDEDALSSQEPVEPLVCPIRFGGTDIGTIAISIARGAEADASSLVPLVARELGGPVRLTTLVEESHLQASTDSLTGLMNRRAFAHSMGIELERSQRHGYPLSVVLLDVDHFKLINDKRGHATGDAVLVAIGALLKKTLRASDHGVRWGGEEFMVALTSTGLEGGRVLAERLRLEIERMHVVDGEGERVPVTASLGLASHVSGETLQQLVDRADRAMYAAKKSGRNRLVVNGDEPLSESTTPSGRPRSTSLVAELAPRRRLV
ncbi:MAG TPA: diguanylate cyclase [Polyangiaceae bacterium]|jgi:two-component system cell cycle response regulator|nr:diguanylate cyclase [Polyangiaceae bacterium]